MMEAYTVDFVAFHKVKGGIKRYEVSLLACAPDVPNTIATTLDESAFRQCVIAKAFDQRVAAEVEPTKYGAVLHKVRVLAPLVSDLASFNRELER